MNVPEAPEDPPIPEPTGQDVDAAGMRGGFPDIGALAPLGDGLSAALVGPDAAVEFFCPLRFDAPALVFPVLDRRRGGRLRFGAVEPSGATLPVTRRWYQPGSAVMVLEWGGASTVLARMRMAMTWPPRSTARRSCGCSRASTGRWMSKRF